MNNIVFVLFVVFNQHGGDVVIPTIEFTTQEKCERAIRSFKSYKSKQSFVSSEMNCMRIEK